MIDPDDTDLLTKIILGISDALVQAEIRHRVANCGTIEINKHSDGHDYLIEINAEPDGVTIGVNKFATADYSDPKFFDKILYIVRTADGQWDGQG